ncbi:hypothetical protein [Actinacidiphila soli]|jgi:hypothetical protein|nr:hypothetical protein [Actinacidiphila soli]
MPLDIYAALGALVRAEATREAEPTAADPQHKEPEIPAVDDPGRDDERS